MSHSGSAMTLSSSTSHGIVPASGKTESAMPKKTNDQWSEGSSAGGSRGGAEFFHEAIKKFAEQSRGSGSMDENCQALSSSEDASMTKGEVHGPHGPPTSLPKRIATEAKAKAYNLVKQAMPSLITFAGMGKCILLSGTASSIVADDVCRIARAGDTSVARPSADGCRSIE